MRITRRLLLTSTTQALIALSTAVAIPTAHSQDRAAGQRPQAAAASAPNGKYYALVIGINDYPAPPPGRAPMPQLKTAVHDAQEIADVLRERYGFKVNLLLNAQATRSNILDAIVDYQATLTDNDSLLIYYAGHGFSTRNADGTYDKAYWLPSDANSALSSNRIIADDLTTDIGQLAARHVLIISDSCYSGGLSGSRDAGSGVPATDPRYLTKMLAEPVTDTGPGNHSIFAAAVLEALRNAEEPIFAAGTVFSNVILPRVAGGSSQVPEYGFIRASGHVAGDFVFTRSAASTPAIATATPSPAQPRPLPESRLTPADAFTKGTALYNAKRYNEALPLLTNSCDANYAAGCVDLGFLYEEGNGIPRDVAQAVALYRKGCNGGDAIGCIDLGVTYEKGTGVPQDVAQAVALYQKGCDGGNAVGCTYLGLMYEHGSGVPQDAVQAAALYRKACDAGDASGCADLGIKYVYGTGVPQDFAQAVALSRKACDAGDGAGCASLGIEYENGAGAPMDKAQALQLYQKSCGAENPVGCRYLGMHYEKGIGVAADKAQAVEAYRKGCDGEDKDSCDALKRLQP